MKTKQIILIQAAIIAIIAIGVYMIYPRVSLSVDGDLVKLKSINAEVIIISENPDFSNPRYLDVKSESSLRLNPGTYYWKASNNLIQGFENSFVIKSEVGLGVENEENGSKLVNIGNVKVNVTKNKDGVMVGHIILEPEEKEKLEDVNYTGRQA